tara:strand:- start:1380 stop:2051 length:672 start_codon:yes stop_codon:yes gene_type:complete
MKKLISVIAGSFLAIMSFNVASAVEMRLGVLGNMAADFGEAKETLKDSGQISKETAVLAHSYASVFAEVALDQAAGLTFGVEYAPETIELEKETRVIPTGRTDSGSQIIDAEVEDLLTAYVALPIGETGAYVRLGYLQATLNTQETLATGSTYANVDIEGTQLGAGYMGEIGDNLFYKLEGVYNEWDNMALNGSEEGGTSGSFNKIDADITGVAARLAVGFRF